MGPFELAAISADVADSFPLLLVEVTLKVTLLATAGYLAAWLLARRSAAVRHRVWTLVFAALLALPIGLLVLPGWQLPLMTNLGVVVQPPIKPALQQLAPIDSHADTDSSSPLDVGSQPAKTYTAVNDTVLPAGEKSQEEIDEFRHSAPTSSRSIVPTTAGTQTSHTGSYFRVNWPFLLLGVWAVGAIVAILPLVAGRLRCRRIVGHGREIDDPRLNEMFAGLLRQLDIEQTVRLVESELVTVPALCGVWRSVIVLPRERDDWTRTFSQQVLLHELSHVRRWDVATNTLARCTTAAYWFHPLVWWALGQLRSLREQACDDAVLAAGTQPHDYAENLLETARRCQPRGTTRSFSAAQNVGMAMATPSTLERRLIAILDDERQRGGVSRRFATVSLAAALVVTMALALPTLRGAAREPVDEPSAASVANEDKSVKEPSSDQQPPGETPVNPPEDVALVIEEIGQQLDAARIGREMMRRLRGQLMRIGQYTGELSRAGRDDTLEAAENTLQQVRRCLAADYQPKATDELQLHVVGCYEGTPFSATHDQARVRVTDTSSPIVLCLTAHTPIVWKVSVDEGVDLRQVILGGRDQRIEVDDPEVSIADYSYRRGDNFREALGSTYTRQDDDHSANRYVGLARKLHELTGMEIATFQGAYRPEEQIVIGPESDVWRREHALPLLAKLYKEATREQRAATLQILRNVTFSFASTRSGIVDDMPRWVGDHTILGPIRGRVEPVRIGFGRIAIDPNGPVFYADGTKRIDPASEEVRDFADDPTVTVPHFSHVCGVTFDQKRRRLVVATLGGSGLLYACDVDQQRWSVLRDMDNVDLLDIVYAPSEDVYYGVSGEYLFTYHPEGAIIDRVPLKETTDYLLDFPRHETRLADAGDWLILTEIATPTEPDERDSGKRWRVHVLNKTSKKIELDCLMQGLATLEEHQAAIAALADERIGHKSLPGHLAVVPERVDTAQALFDELSRIRVNVIRDPASGHYYELVKGRVGVTWQQALEIAATRSYQGIPGHLVTITSEAENRFLTLNFAGAGTSWAGASDEDEEGTWKWVCGPEAGQVFWEGNAQSGKALGYAAWNDGEPNDMSGGEHYLAWNWASDVDNLSLWNDWDARRTLQAFVVEYSPVAEDATDK